MTIRKKITLKFKKKEFKQNSDKIFQTMYQQMNIFSLGKTDFIKDTQLLWRA